MAKVTVRKRKDGASKGKLIKTNGKNARASVSNAKVVRKKTGSATTGKKK